MATTKKPTGITVVRDGGLKFVITWKIGDKDYSAGHQLRWRAWKTETKHTAWTDIKLGATATSRAVSLTASDWYPNSGKPKLYYFEVEIRGKRNPTTSSGETTTYDWSDWAGKKWKLKTPPKPKVTATPNESQTPTQSTVFAWDVASKVNDEKHFTRIKYETIFIKACKEKDGSKLAWKSSTNGWATSTSTSASSSSTRSESTTTLANDSYTRWFRVQSVGVRGVSDWVYSKHVYARPYKAKIKEATANVKGTNTAIYIKWTSATDAAHPINETTTEYLFATPASGLTVPSGSTGTQASSTKDGKGNDAVNIVVDNTTVQLDQCLWVRVNNRHDKNVTYGDWKLVTAGKLTKPTALTVTWDSSTRYVAVTSATNASNVPDSKLALVYTGADGKSVVVGIIQHGSSTLSGVKCPAGTNNPQFSVYAFQGTSTAQAGADGVTTYSVKANMKSAAYKLTGSIPAAPEDVTAEPSGRPGEVMLTWKWSWSAANKAEISWSQNEFAWESTDAPSTYLIDSTRAAQWRVSGLETGYTYYFKVRLVQQTDDSIVYGEYSETLSVDLTSAPNKPVLELSSAVIPVGGSLTANWGYLTTDGTDQVAATICVATVAENASTPITYGDTVGTAMTAQHADINTSTWTAGNTYYLCVKVRSGSNVDSEWSDPVPVQVAEPLSISITHSLTATTPTNRTNSTQTLQSLPLTATVTGAGAGGITTLIIERAQDYSMDRPDESKKDGFAGETICIYQQYGEDQISIGVDELDGALDDGATYRLIATVEDGLGQYAEIDPIDFEVHWSSQAVIPTATVTTEDNITKITATAGSNTPANSKVDIYRLSVDKPQLIVKGGAFGTVYVDPYPTLGEQAGYRCVCVTPNGDYIATDKPAWVDVTGKYFDNKTGLIDFNGIQIPITYNAKLSAAWSKDFKETKYLGGTIRGDWNPAISRRSTINVTIPSYDTENLQKMRRLADWNGICHVRSQDGSSYAADVQVSASTGYDVGGQVEDFTLTITRIEPEVLDGIPYSQWVNS